MTDNPEGLTVAWSEITPSLIEISVEGDAVGYVRKVDNLYTPFLIAPSATTDQAQAIQLAVNHALRLLLATVGPPKVPGPRPVPLARLH